MDTLFGLSFALLGLWAYLALSRRTDDALHPLAVFLAGWLGVFGFAHFRLSETYDEFYYAAPFGALTYAVVLGAAAAFAVGFWLIDPAVPPLDRDRLRAALSDGIRWPRLAVVAVLTWAVATVVTVYFVRVAGEIPLLSLRIDELRRVFKLPKLGYLFDLHFVAALLGAMLAGRAPTRGRRMLWIALSLSSVAQLSFTGVRASPMTAVAWIAIYWLYRARTTRLAYLMVFGAVALAIFFGVESFRRNMYEFDPNLVNPRLDLSPGATIWGHSAAGFKNLQYTLESGVSPLYLGAASYDLPKTVAPSLRSVDEAVSYVYGTHNSPTFLSFIFFDFGPVGLIMLPGLYGALAAFVYRRFRAAAGVFWLVVHIDFLLAIALTFRTHRFLGNGLIWFALVAGLVHLFVRVPPPEVPALAKTRPA